MDAYQLTFRQLFNSEPINTVWHYVTDDAGANAQELAEAFADDVMPMINALQVDDMQNDLIRVIHLWDLTDFHEEIAEGTGSDNTTDMMPVHDALSFTLRLNTRAVQPGGKRISGIPETAQVNGIITQSGYITAMNALRVRMDDILPATSTGVAEYTPAVIKRISYEVTEDGIVKTKYRLPVDESELEYGVVTAVLMKTKISHQTSRGNGR